MTEMPRILVVGSDGVIGGVLLRALPGAMGTTRRSPGDRQVSLDLDADPDSWPIPGPAQVVVNCAAVARIEVCKRDPAGSRRVNVDAVVTLAERCHEARLFLIHLSTDKVFSGRTPHIPPDAPFAPLTEYGRQKADADRALAGMLAEHIPLAIIRLSRVLTPGFALFRGWRDALLHGEPIQPFADMTLAPVPLPVVVEAVTAIARGRLSGVFQLSGDVDVSYADVARRMAGQLGVDAGLVQPVNATQSGLFEEAFSAYTSLDCAATCERLHLRLPSTWEAVDWALA